MMKTLEVDLGNRSYPIYIGTDLIDQASLFSACEKATSIYIVSNTTVAPLYAERLTKTLSTFGKPVRTIVLPDGDLPKVKGQDDAEKAKWIPIGELDTSLCYEDHAEIISYFVGA